MLLFDRAVQVVEFCRLFAPGLATDKLNALTLEKLEVHVLLPMPACTRWCLRANSMLP